MVSAWAPSDGFDDEEGSRWHAETAQVNNAIINAVPDERLEWFIKTHFPPLRFSANRFSNVNVSEILSGVSGSGEPGHCDFDERFPALPRPLLQLRSIVCFLRDIQPDEAEHLTAFAQ